MTATRRRGDELNEALLDAAWDELSEVGYADLTMEGVAARAGTSRPVLYRRWPDKEALIADALKRVVTRERPVVPDTGSLRGDLLALLEQVNERAPRFITTLHVRVADYFRATDRTPSQLREALGDDLPDELGAVYERAQQRGEIDPNRLTPLKRALPLSVLRQEILFRRRPVSRDVLVEIVDEIVLPVVAARS